LDTFKLAFELTDLKYNGSTVSSLSASDIRVKVDGEEQDDDSLTYKPNVEI
jgi:hypothetical protein